MCFVSAVNTLTSITVGINVSYKVLITWYNLNEVAFVNISQGMEGVYKSRVSVYPYCCLNYCGIKNCYSMTVTSVFDIY
jgi:hypothetical protein